MGILVCDTISNRIFVFYMIETIKEAIEKIDKVFPNAHHYISTIGVKGTDYSWVKDNVTLQVSLHSLDEDKRNWLIPFKNKLSIEDLGKISTNSNLKTTVNLTLVDESDFSIDKLKENFNTENFFIKLSPINPNTTSESNDLGLGVIKGKNLK